MEGLSKAIAERQDELVFMLRQLVSFPTVSPPARNSKDAQQWMGDRLQKLGFAIDRWSVFPGDDNLAGILRGTDSANYHSLVLNGHMDVAEVGDDSGWRYPPFQLTEGPNGRLYGRGTADMKGALAAALFAIQILQEHGVKLRGDLLFHSVTGEEAGEAGTLSALERGHSGDFALVMDTSQLRMQGQGGVITGWITIESPFTLHDGVRAKTIHAGGGVYGANAIEKMMKMIAALQDLERHWAVMKSYPGFLPGSTTINPAVIEGGRHAAFLADKCALWITVHFYPNESFEQVTKEIEQHLLAAAAADPWLRQHPPVFCWGGRSMIEERGEIFPSLEPDPTHPAVQQLIDAFSNQCGFLPEIGMSPSVNDAGWFAHQGIPAIIFGPGDLLQAHAVNESVEKRELVTFAQVLAQFIVSWCNTPKRGRSGDEQV